MNEPVIPQVCSLISTETPCSSKRHAARLTSVTLKRSAVGFSDRSLPSVAGDAAVFDHQISAPKPQAGETVLFIPKWQAELAAIERYAFFIFLSEEDHAVAFDHARQGLVLTDRRFVLRSHFDSLDCGRKRLGSARYLSLPTDHNFENLW